MLYDPLKETPRIHVETYTSWVQKRNYCRWNHVKPWDNFLLHQKLGEMMEMIQLTPPKFNMEPENKSLEKQSPFGNHDFQVPY